MSSEVTVVIHTRDRAADLADLLEHLRAQRVPKTLIYDVLVVDNASSDQTPELIERVGRDFPVRVRYAREMRVGRPFALNTGVALASAPILVFTDDDTIPEPTWLYCLWHCMVEEGADAVTGRVLPRWLGERPGWLTDEAVASIGRLGCIDHGPVRLRSRDGHGCRWFTSNLALRRDAVAGLGGWDERLRYYQDTDLHRRARAAGFSIVYEPGAIVHHKLRSERLTLEYFRRRRRWGGRYRAQIAGWKTRHLITVMPWRLHAAPWRAGAAWLSSWLRGEAWWKRFQHELELREALAVWWQRLRLWPSWCSRVATGRIPSS